VKPFAISAVIFRRHRQYHAADDRIVEHRTGMRQGLGELLLHLRRILDAHGLDADGLGLAARFGLTSSVPVSRIYQSRVSLFLSSSPRVSNAASRGRAKTSSIPTTGSTKRLGGGKKAAGMGVPLWRGRCRNRRP
jgi:hypothetical protein